MRTLRRWRSGEGFLPEAAPFRVVGEDGLGVGRAAGDEGGVEGASGGLAGRLVAQVNAPAHDVGVVGRPPVRGAAVHEDDAAFLFPAPGS